MGMDRAAASTAASSAADRPEVPSTQALPDSAMAAAVRLRCGRVGEVDDHVGGGGESRQIGQQRDRRPGELCRSPARPMPPVRAAPAAGTSSARSWPMRPVMPAMPMRVAMLASLDRARDSAWPRRSRPGAAAKSRSVTGRTIRPRRPSRSVTSRGVSRTDAIRPVVARPNTHHGRLKGRRVTISHDRSLRLLPPGISGGRNMRWRDSSRGRNSPAPGRNRPAEAGRNKRAVAKR